LRGAARSASDRYGRGKTELVGYSAVARRAAELDPISYQRLDTLGWVPFDAMGQSGVASFAAFFRSLGKTVASIFDLQPPEEFAAIMASSDAAFQQPYAGFEQMLYAEVSAAAQAWFVKYLVTNGDWPSALAGQVPVDGAPDDAYRNALYALFCHKKGDEFLTIFFNACMIEHFPQTMLATLRRLKERVVRAAPPPALPAGVFG
jgi:putative ATP-dependent endonuclease of the OLD family